MYRLLDIIKFLAKQNLAFRGHRETLEESAEINSGNFLELVKLLSKYDPVLREHVLRVTLGKPHSLSYLSPQIQNEFVNCLGDLVRTKIIEQVKNSKYYCIIFDSTPDISHKDQLSQVIPYVKMDDNDVKVEESFLRFIEMKGKTAEQITEQILKLLEEDGLQIQDCRGQAFDNAAIMAGHRSGIQKRIADTNPRAVFVPCTNHTLNLARGYGFRSFRNVFRNIVYLFFWLSTSMGYLNGNDWSECQTNGGHKMEQPIRCSRHCVQKVFGNCDRIRTANGSRRKLHYQIRCWSGSTGNFIFLIFNLSWLVECNSS